MSRTRTFVTVAALAVGLTAPLGAVPAQASADRSAAPAKVTRFVSYGDGAITVPKKHKAVLRFRGRRGDVVTLSGVSGPRTHLYRQSRRVTPTWRRSGVFRLPSSGTFAFRVGSYGYADRKIGLLKVRLRRVDTDGSARRTPRKRRGYIDMAVIRLRSGDRLTVDTGRTEQRVYLPGGEHCLGYGGPLLLRPGHRVRVADDNQALCEGEVRPGKALVRVRSGRWRVTAAPALEVAVQPDGAPVTVSADRRVQRELVLTFGGTADDLVYVQDVDGAGVTGGRTLVDRWERPLNSLVTGRSTSEEGFVLLATGQTEISAVNDSVGPRGATVRLRKAVRVDDLVADGPAREITFDGSGTWLYSVVPPAPEGLLRLERTSTTVAAGQAWVVDLTERSPWACGQEPGGPMGCADNFVARISDSVASSTAGVRQPVAVAHPSPGTTGTVGISLKSVPY